MHEHSFLKLKRIRADMHAHKSMDFAHEILTCDCAYIAVRLDHEKEKHANCVYNRRFRDLIVEYPERADMLYKMWFLAVSVPCYGFEWDLLQQAYPDVPGLRELGLFGPHDPQYADVIRNLSNLPVAADVASYFKLSNYQNIPVGEDAMNEMCIVYDTQLWELTECLGDCIAGDIRKSEPVSERTLSQWLPQPLTKSAYEAVSDPDVIAFCEYLRYY
jgi:hypothetical protein